MAEDLARRARNMAGTLARAQRRCASCVLLLLPVLALGCVSEEPRSHASVAAGEGISLGSGSASRSCPEGALRECHVTLGIEPDRIACYDGTQRCDSGVWSPCADGRERQFARALGAAVGGGGLLALSAPQECVGNPCNPFCQRYLEEPEVPIETEPGAPLGPRSGDPDSVPDQGDCAWAADCQDNQRCREPQTDEACSHSKCVVGSGLSDACRAADPCVAAICSVAPGCCGSSGSWSGACVGRVKTVCDAFCGEAETALCQHHVCDEGAALRCNNDCVERVCAADARCCSDGWTSACVTLATDLCGGIATAKPPALPHYADLCGFAVYSYNDLYLGQKGVLSGVIAAGGNVTVTQGELTNVDLRVRGSLRLDNSTATGRALVGGNVDLVNQVTFSSTGASPVLEVGGATTIHLLQSRLTGDVVATTPPKYGGATAPNWSGSLIAPTAPPATPQPTIPTKTGLVCNSGLMSRWVNPGEVLSLPPGNYGTIGINSNPSSPAVLRLREGSYTFYSLILNSSSKVELAYGSTGIDINVCSSLTVNTKTVFTPPPPSYKDLRWYYGGTAQTNIDLQGGTNPAYAFPGVFIAPNAHVVVAPNTAMAGVIYAKSLRFEPGLMLAQDVSGSMCGTAGDPICDAGIDMAVTPTAPEAGVCEPWAPGETDAACTRYDLALGVPCEDVVVVCNHGTSAAPSGVQLALFDTSYPWASTSPNLADGAYLGECRTTEAVPAGACISQACDADLLDRDLYIVAIPPASAGAECSALDNWAHYTKSTECACQWGAVPSESVDPGTGQGCALPLGSAPGTDLSNIDAILMSSDGTGTPLTRQGGAAACGEGWYLSGTDLTLCPNTCAALAGDAGAWVKASVGCASLRAPSAITEVYESNCEPGFLPQWDMLTWRSTTPGESTIKFEARVARSLDELAWATFAEVGVARNDGSVDTQTCDAFNHHLVPECPAMFYRLVESGIWELTDLRRPVLELKATLSPDGTDASLGPSLERWQVQFSCVDGE